MFLDASSRRKSMSIVLVALLIGVLACNAPAASTASPEATAQATLAPTATTEIVVPSAAAPSTAIPTTEGTAAPQPNVVYEGISFYYDLSLASSWTVEIVPPPDTSTGAPTAWMEPTHYAFSFDTYPVANSYFQPQVKVYPTAAFEQLDPIIAAQIAKLRQLLADRPSDFPDPLPFLPVPNAGQVLHVQVAYLDFQNGSGIRYLTQFDQALIPINNDELIYTFQGLTTDGSHYVVVTMPVSHPGLPADGSQAPGGDWNAFSSNFETYLNDVKQQLESADVYSFRPALTLLDQLVQSINAAPGG